MNKGLLSITGKRIVIIDIGYTKVKLADVSMQPGKITVLKCATIRGSERFFSGNDMQSIGDFVKALCTKMSEMGVKKHREVNIILPRVCLQSKIIEEHVTKDSELKHYIETDSASMLSMASKTINCVDWVKLGELMSNNETIKICEVASVPRKISYGIASEFEKNGYRVTWMSSPLWSISKAFDIYKADYEHPVKLFVDFGATTMKMIVANAGVPVYVREAPIGGEAALHRVFERLQSVRSASATGEFNVAITKKLLESVGMQLVNKDESSEQDSMDAAYSNYDESYNSNESAVESLVESPVESADESHNERNVESSTDDTNKTGDTENVGKTEKDESNHRLSIKIEEEKRANMLDIVQKEASIDLLEYNKCIEENYDELISEVIKTIQQCSEPVKCPTKIIYSGNVKKVKGFIDRLRDNVEIPVEEFNISKHLSGSGYRIILDSNIKIGSENKGATNEINSDFLNIIGMATAYLQ